MTVSLQTNLPIRAQQSWRRYWTSICMMISQLVRCAMSPRGLGSAPLGKCMRAVGRQLTFRPPARPCAVVFGVGCSLVGRAQRCGNDSRTLTKAEFIAYLMDPKFPDPVPPLQKQLCDAAGADYIWAELEGSEDYCQCGTSLYESSRTADEIEVECTTLWKPEQIASMRTCGAHTSEITSVCMMHTVIPEGDTVTDVYTVHCEHEDCQLPNILPHGEYIYYHHQLMCGGHSIHTDGTERYL
jgi:hypothetical protein